MSASELSFRIGGWHLPVEAAAIESGFADLDDRAARGWVDRLARALEVALLIESGRADIAERLRGRPLGLIPGTAAMPRVTV